MARKKVYWTKLSRKQRAEYNRRLANNKAIRQGLIEARQAGARSMIGESPSSLRSVPDLVLPKEYQKRRFHSQREFNKEMAKLKKFRFDEKEYFKRQYKRTIVSIFGDNLREMMKESTGQDVKPDGRFGVYTEEQIKNHPEFEGYMETFNDMQRMTGEQFKRAYFEGFIVPFKYIYREMQNVGNSGNAETPYLEQQTEMLESFRASGRM